MAKNEGIAQGEDSIATGVDSDQGDGPSPSGAVYVFTRSGTTWTQESYIKPSNTGSGDNFGEVVALRSAVLVVGSRSEDGGGTGVGGDESSNALPDSGAAYLFSKTSGAWQQLTYLKASNAGEGDEFGTGVAVSDDCVVVGAYREDSSASDVGGDQNDNASSDSGALYAF